MSEEVKEQHCLLLGDKVPSFTAQTTQGEIHFPDDFRGEWVILFSHPADFTPVCTTEFIYFAEMMKEFESLNTRLIGLSIDSLSSHLAWLYAIQQDIVFHGIKQARITFPLIADLSGDIARQFGMLHPNASHTKTVRAVFFVNPNGIVRTILYYPASLGRNFDELKRILISLQLNETLGVATPANWQPGDDVIVSTPETMAQVEQCAKKNEAENGAWFLSLKPLPIEKIETVLKKQKVRTSPSLKTKPTDLKKPH